MNSSQIYILITLILLAMIAIVAILRIKKGQNPISKLATFAFIFIMAGLIFGENQLIGYGLIGIGMILAIVDIIKKLKK